MRCPSAAAPRRRRSRRPIVAAGSRVGKRASRTIRSGDVPTTQTNLVPPASMPPSMVGVRLWDPPPREGITFTPDARGRPPHRLRRPPRRRRCRACASCSTARSRGVFGGVHVLPFFHAVSTAPTPASTRSTTPRSTRGWARWDDVRALARGPRRHGRRDRQPRLRRLAAVPRLRRARRRVAVRRHVPDLRARLSRTAPPKRTCSRSTARGPGCRSRRTSRATANAAACGRRSRRSRSTSTSATRRAGSISTGPRRACRGGRPRDPPRRGRATRSRRPGTELLHDPGDVRVHRRPHRAGARARARGAGRGPRPLSRADRDRRSRSTGSTTSRCRRWCCTR